MGKEAKILESGGFFPGKWSVFVYTGLDFDGIQYHANTKEECIDWCSYMGLKVNND